MSKKDEFETIGDRSRARKQRAGDRRQQQRAAANTQKQVPPEHRPAKARDFTVVGSRQDVFDTVPAETVNWWLPVLLGGSFGILATIAVGTRIFSPTRLADPSATVPALPADVSEAELLLEQANLLAASGNLAGAVEIATSVPADARVAARAQQQAATWQQAIASQREAELATARAQAAEIRRQQEVAQAQAQAAEARRQQQAAQAQAQAAEARRQQEVARAQAQATEARRQQQAAQTRAQVAETRRQQEAAQAQATATAQARRQQEAAQAQATATAEARRQQQVAQAQAQAQQQPQSLGSSNSAAASAQAQSQSTGSATADPFLRVNIPRTSLPATAPPAVQVARAATVPSGDESFGFRNVVVRASKVAIELRDNVDEDGDFVTLRVNGRDYATNTLIRNSGKTIIVPLEPGQNRVEILGIKDGQGGITLEANVAGIGNVNSRPIPEGSKASFIITRE